MIFISLTTNPPIRGIDMEIIESGTHPSGVCPRNRQEYEVRELD
jgi:hypothetical protein